MAPILAIIIVIGMNIKNDTSKEGEGFLIALAYLGRENRSDLMIFDAQNVSCGPLARAMLPHRIPYGFHGNWRQG